MSLPKITVAALFLSLIPIQMSLSCDMTSDDLVVALHRGDRSLVQQFHGQTEKAMTDLRNHDPQSKKRLFNPTVVRGAGTVTKVIVFGGAVGIGVGCAIVIEDAIPLIPPVVGILLSAFIGNILGHYTTKTFDTIDLAVDRYNKNPPPPAKSEERE